MKRILELPTSTPSAFLHLELGTTPIRFVLMVRRLNFLQYILKEDGNSLIHSFLVAQMENTMRGDWWEIVQKDMAELRLDLSLSEIKMMSQQSFKNKVKIHANEAAFTWLQNEQQNLKKIKDLNYSSLVIQNYLKSERLNVQQRKFLSHLRGKMIKVRKNYSKMHECLLCPLCSIKGYHFEDSQEHLLQCVSLCKDSEIDTGTNYSDIFSDLPEKYENITVLLQQKLRLRERLLRNT